MYCSLYLHCCGWWWCFSLAFVDEKKMPLSRLRPLFLPLTSMMIHHPSLSQHEFHGHYGWIPMDMYCILSILNFPAKSSVHSKYILQWFWIHSDTLEYIWIHFSWIWILFFLKYFLILLDTSNTIFPWYLNFHVWRKTRLLWGWRSSLPTWVLLEPKEIWETQLSPFVTTKTGPIGIHWKGTRIKKELLKGSLLTCLTFASPTIFSLPSKLTKIHFGYIQLWL